MSDRPRSNPTTGEPGPKYRPARRKGWRRFVGWKAILLYVLGLLLLGVGVLAVAFATIDVPKPNDFSTSESTIVYYDDGETELGRFNAENREVVNSEDVPDTVKQAVVAAEDRSFYDNPGFSIPGIIRATWDQLRGSGSAGGGSTITQQYVKNYYLTQEQTWSRKLQEFVIAVKIDQDIDKDQILTSYLNTIWFGRGAYGVQTASRAYFDADVSDLDLAQSIALAAILRSPGRYDPTLSEANSVRFEERFNYVLDGMVDIGALDEETADETEPPQIKPEQRQNRYGGPDGYLLQMVRDELRALGFEDSQIDAGGLRVTTSFNSQAQQAAVRAVEEERPTENADRVHVALAAVRPGDGGVVAMYGGPDAVEQSFNDAVDALVQPGSAAKPFTLAAALSEGYSLDSRFAGNSPYEAEGLGPPVANQGDVSYGSTVDLLQATERSINTAYVDLTRTIGSQTVVDAMVRAGIPEDAPGLEANPRVTLGIAAVSALQLTEGYATLAAQGMHTDPYTISEVRDTSGEVLYQQDGESQRAFDADVMADVTYALTQVVDGPNGTGYEAQGLGRPAAAKTGTHQDLTSWFAGYTPQLAASVAYFRGEGPDAGTEPLTGVAGLDTFAGGQYPARTWTAFMRSALEGQPIEEFPEPANIDEDVQVRPPQFDDDPDEAPGDDDTAGEEPTDEPETEQPTEEPTTEEPTQEPTEEPTTEEPPDDEPTSEPPPEEPTQEPPDDEPTEPPPEDPTEESTGGDGSNGEDSNGDGSGTDSSDTETDAAAGAVGAIIPGAVRRPAIRSPDRRRRSGRRRAACPTRPRRLPAGASRPS